ncbi:RING-finger-containing ubiquitin ligase [Pyrenophora tritici-repentis]|nr:RING-finger-containing ubiquitin ligase [Pyrenophora tritici-repentis]KAI1580975.1 RING-finger-containing ubiquitin ligase [Pyrenophora tritici-repentis]KAI1603327.1 RING-finger-containing ubiquitin ligase [Pyrenophora tritici-repentis]PZD00465.1 RING-finger-containing ubiquitin ligase [Pyrenophora tritici-repentis]
MTPNANPRPSGPYMHNSHAYGSQHDVSISNTERAREARIGSNSRHHSQGVVASHFLAQDRETWMDFLREGTDISTNQPPTSSISTPTTASEDRANPSSSRYTLPTRPPPHADSSPPSSSDRKRRLTTADSPMRRPSSIRMHSENTGATIANPILLDSPPAVRALPPTPSIPTQANIAAPRRQSDIVLPPWQPDKDECPICGEELPPKGPNNDDTERTQHIQECIALHSASPGPTAALAQVTSASLPNQRTRGMSSAGNGEGASNQSRMSHAARGMFPYVATEKDCIDDEGRQAECTICLEDFEAGDKMARLVCWCKFHESCIKEWWDKKGRGACPTHQLQE